MKSLALLAAVIICSLPSYSQSLLKGEVADFKTGEKIAGATLRSGKLQVISNQQGNFEITLGQENTLFITAIGYDSTKLTVSNPKQFLQIQLQPATNNLNDVVVSGTMRSIQRSESPIPVEVFTAKFFKKNPTPSVFEALGTLNGVQPQLNCNICNTGDIHINGMEGPYTMVLIDGMPIISSLSRIYGFSGIPTSLVKRMEVVKGPASTLYGSDAVAGLINIITKDSYSAGKFAADISATSLGEMNADFSAGLHTKKANGLIGVNVFNYWTKQDINHDNFTDQTQQRRVSLFTKWDFDRKNKLPSALSVRYMTENRWGGEMNWNKHFRGSDSIYGESIITNRLEVVGNYGLKGGANNMTLDYSYSYHNQDSYYGKMVFDAKQHLGFVQLRGERKMGNHQLLWGIPIRYTWYDDNTVITEKQGANHPSKQWNLAGFLQDEWKLTAKTMLLTGLRYEYNNLQGSVVAPRLALKWQPSVTHTFRFSAGNGYRVVNLFTEDHAALTGAREVVIQNDLKPERSWNGNINYTAQWMPRWGFIGLDASVFYTYFTNKIIADYNTDPNKIIYDNLGGHAVSQGISINMDVVIKKGPKLLAGITWMDVYAVRTTDDGQRTKEQQQFAPRFSANYAVSYTINKWNTSFDLTGKMYGPQRLPVLPNDYRPEYSQLFTLMNLQVTKKFNATWEIYAAAKNLLNFIPENPIIHGDDPFDKPGGKYFDNNGNARPDTNPNGYTFDPSYSYAPMQGIKGILGVRYSL
jgi:outer membrane receptor for ferrienterochelin and colicins